MKVWKKGVGVVTACSQTESALEALLFLADAPLPVKELAQAAHASPLDTQQALASLQTRLREDNHGIQLYELAGGWQFLSAEQHHRMLYDYFSLEDARPLSQAACEVLAIVAYFQPVTRMHISSLRGVNSDTLVQSLMQRNLLCEVGHSLDVGNPALLGTTPTFLDNFNLSTIKDLTPLDSFALSDELIERIQQKFEMNDCIVSPVQQHEKHPREAQSALRLYHVQPPTVHAQSRDNAEQPGKAAVSLNAKPLPHTSCITYKGIEVHFDDEE